MSSDLVAGLAADVFARHSTPDVVSASEGAWAPTLWDRVEAAGLTKVGLSEDQGGSGVGWADAAAVLRMAGRAAAPIPIAENLVAVRLLADATLAVPAGPLTLDPGAGRDLETSGSGPSLKLRGHASRVPWARESKALVTVVRGRGGPMVALVATAGCRIERGFNMAREPRDRVVFDDVEITDVAQAPSDAGDDLRLAGALSRAALIAGALDRILELTTEFVRVREQFGRPIVRFQAIQHGLAVLAGEVAAAGAAVDAAVANADAAARRGASLSSSCVEEIAVARVRTAMAATEGARIAHQLHGAIGVTFEHQLHHFTSRLWSWRDEFGGEREWAIRLGRAVSGSGRAYWQRLTRAHAGP